MNKKRAGYAAGIGAGILAVGIALCPGKKQEELRLDVPMVVQNPVREVQIAPVKNIYAVKKGDYLSGIIYDELGLRGREIYTRCLEIQTNNNFGPERDISRVVNGRLVPGKDGFVDLIYPGENIDLD